MHKISVNYVSLRMAGMEMDCNLKKIGQLFHVVPVYFKEVAKS